jgi:hypothetical protein
MFRQLSDFRAPRPASHAILFYVVYLFLGLITSALLGAAAAAITGDTSFEQGLLVGQVFAVVYTGLFSLALLRAKRQLGNGRYAMIGMAGLVAAAAGGLLLGLIVPAFLATRPVNPIVDAIAHPVVDATARPIERVAAH